MRNKAWIALLMLITAACGGEVQDNSAEGLTKSADATDSSSDASKGLAAGTVPNTAAEIEVEWGKLEDACRGAINGDAPETVKACADRDAFARNVTEAGWCHGTASQAEYEKRWQRCQAPTASAKAEVWQCAGIEPQPFTVELAGNTYRFRPKNPFNGAVSGAVKIIGSEKYEDGTVKTNLNLEGGGEPEGAWAYLKAPGKRKALLWYAVETSGDGSECTPPGAEPEYIFN